MRFFLSILLVLFCLQSEADNWFKQSIVKSVKQGTYEFHISKFGSLYISDIDSVALPISEDSTLVIPHTVEVEAWLGEF